MPNTHVRAAAEGMPTIKTPHPATDLSFMRVIDPEGTGINYWTVESAGSYGADWKKGHELGREYLDYIGHHPTNGNATLLGCIVNDMMVQRKNGGKLSGVELGFLQEVNKYAMAAMKVVVHTMGKPEGGNA
ncbi:hypothetical protein NKI12_21295 [Mesorhizobium australicum]|uniref:Uncharacterized protein n=1 Tax=Mesorhizobium australicum TaxID=536018 RepID=A0ACC6T2S6_9HYPH